MALDIRQWVGAVDRHWGRSHGLSAEGGDARGWAGCARWAENCARPYFFLVSRCLVGGLHAGRHHEEVVAGGEAGVRGAAVVRGIAGMAPPPEVGVQMGLLGGGGAVPTGEMSATVTFAAGVPKLVMVVGRAVPVTLAVKYRRCLSGSKT